MRKETANQYALELIQTVGYVRAFQISRRCMETSNLKNVAELPVGPIFHYKHRGQGDWKLNKNHYVRLNGFWTQVFHIIKKREKQYVRS